MSAEQKKPKVVQIEGTGFIHMENLKTVNDELVYTIRAGAITIQLNKENAEYVCSRLKLWLEEDDEETKLRILKTKANINSSKKFPLGA